MKMKIKHKIPLIVVIVLAGLFFLLSSSFNYLTQTDDYRKWTSPDETANYFFSKHYALKGSLAYLDPASIVGDNLIMPRSIRSDFGWLKPVSFLGLILIYGSIAKVLGIAVLPYLTPLFAALGIIFYFLIIRRIFSQRVALISSALLSFFPVYLYYSSRSMFHNVLFIDLLLIFIYFLLLTAKKRKKDDAREEAKGTETGKEESEKEEEKKESFWVRFRSMKFSKAELWAYLFAVLAGVFLGLTAITRTSELIWLLPALFVTWLFYARRYNFMKLFLIVAGFCLALLPNIYFNQLLYSAPLYGGYNEMNRSLDDISNAGTKVWQENLSWSHLENLGKTIYHNVFYFGLDLEQSFEMAQHYIYEMFPYLSILFVLGLLILLVNLFIRFDKKYLLYVLLFFFISFILIIYYGSWVFNDNPDPNRYTIGNSYTRYWLPIYLFMIPLAALFIDRFSSAFIALFTKGKTKLTRLSLNLSQVAIVLGLSFINLSFVYFGSEEGIAHLYYNNLREKETTERVFALTEPNSIIITKYYDKFLFPERRVIMSIIPDEELLTSSAKLVNHYPLYYYYFNLSPADVDYLNERKLKSYGLYLEEIERTTHEFSLYSLTKRPIEETEENLSEMKVD